MKIQTTRFGEIEIDEDLVITLREGLVGMPALKRFTILQHGAASLLYWLQSLEDPSKAFVVANPLHFFPAYEIEVPEEDLEALAIEGTEDVALFTILTVRHGGREVTANLLGPVVVNTQNREGKQFVLPREDLSTRHVVVADDRPGNEAASDLARELLELVAAPVVSAPRDEATACHATE